MELKKCTVGRLDIFGSFGNESSKTRHEITVVYMGTIRLQLQSTSKWGYQCCNFGVPLRVPSLYVRIGYQCFKLQSTPQWGYKCSTLEYTLMRVQVICQSTSKQGYQCHNFSVHPNGGINLLTPVHIKSSNSKAS